MGLRDLFILDEGENDRKHRQRADFLVKLLSQVLSGKTHTSIVWRDKNNSWAGGQPISTVPTDEVCVSYKCANFVSAQHYPELARANIQLIYSTRRNGGAHHYNPEKDLHWIRLYYNYAEKISPTAWREHVMLHGGEILRDEYNTFFHEMVHMLDTLRYKGKEYKTVRTSSSGKSGQYGPAYHNHEVEVNAYLQEFFNNMEQEIRAGGLFTKLFKDGGIRDEREFLNWMQYKLGCTLPDFYDQMRGDTYRRFVKRSLQMYKDLKS